jgi:ABC-type multidrug transport system fused ATPase/permease subunit
MKQDGDDEESEEEEKEEEEETNEDKNVWSQKTDIEKKFSDKNKIRLAQFKRNVAQVYFSASEFRFYCFIVIVISIIIIFSAFRFQFFFLLFFYYYCCYYYHYLFLFRFFLIIIIVIAIIHSPQISETLTKAQREYEEAQKRLEEKREEYNNEHSIILSLVEEGHRLDQRLKTSQKQLSKLEIDVKNAHEKYEASKVEATNAGEVGCDLLLLCGFVCECVIIVLLCDSYLWLL